MLVNKLPCSSKCVCYFDTAHTRIDDMMPLLELSIVIVLGASLGEHCMISTATKLLPVLMYVCMHRRMCVVIRHIIMWAV